MKRLRNKKSQQLVEFLLAAPFLIIMLGILTEYAYALNINMTLSHGLKAVTSSIYSEIKPATTGEEIKQSVLNNLTTYMNNNNAPTKSENNLKVSYVTEGQTSIFMARYTYIPAFTLPSVYFRIMPEQFDFLATSAVPSSFLNTNNYDTSITSAKLDGIWSASDFSSLNNYNGIKKGIMATLAGSNPSTETNMLFLVLDPSTSKYRLVHWNGTVDNCSLDPGTGLISGSGCGTHNGNKLINYLKDTNNKYYNVVFVYDNDIPADLNSAAFPEYWLTGSGKISDASSDGILKRALALVNLTTNLSIGNYDNIDVSSYNPDIIHQGSPSGGGGNMASYSNNSTYYIDDNYQITNFGSIVFVHTSQDTNAINKIIINSSPSEYSYNFNN